MKRLIAFVVIVVAAFLGGYWPQHQQLLQARNQTATVKSQLSQADSTLHLCQLQAQLVALVEAATNKNYTDALGLSTKFFDALSHVADNTPPSDLKSSLQAILNQRDTLTAALARGDPKSQVLLTRLLADLSRSIAGKESPSSSKA